MQLTSAGKLLTVIVGLIVFITTLRHLMKNELLDEENDFMNAMTVIVMFFFSTIVTFFSVVIVYSIFFFSYKTTDNFHTIYSNHQDAKVVFKTNLDDAEFVGGSPVKKDAFRNKGTLILSKDGVEVKKDIYSTRYFGDKELGSIVEKIEYSNSVWETKLFGISLAKSKNHHALKIYLKKTTEKSAKDEKDAKIKKELNSILESSE